MTTLTKKMLGYALGRTVLASDQPLLREMVAAGGTASFADLASRIVTSRQFRHRIANDVVHPGSATQAGAETAANDRPSPSVEGTR
jgi:hypothetical protein